MREIKFRAYHLDWNKYFEKGTDINSISYNSQFDMIDLNRVLWEQYTGLKDKSSVEIYEGDIVKINNNYDFIEFQDYSFCTHNQHEPLANYVYDTVSGNPKFLDDAFEVVGNIHENADLLEEKS